MDFWIGIGTVVVGSLVVTAIIALMSRSRWRWREKKIVEYLQSNTEDKAGRQYLSISEIASGTSFDKLTVRGVLERSAVLHTCPSDSNKIGLYEKRRSVYEERGILRL